MLTVEAFRVEVGREEAGGTDLSGLTLVGSGWHPALFRSEAEALVGPVGFVHPRVVITNSIDEEALNRLSRSALVDEVLCKAEHSEVIEPTRIIQRITDWASKNLPNGSFAVRVRVIGSGLAGFSRSAIAQGVGGELSSDSHPVDLENPENEIVVILAGPEDPPNHPDPLYLSPPMIIWGLKQENWQRSGWGGRSPMDRPFFQPVSLEPRLARLMISLGHRSDTEPTTVIDPFCGTGGIAIEAMLAGLNVLASDLDPKMVKGTKENLQWASEDLCSGYSATWDVQESGVGLTPCLLYTSDAADE